MHNRSLKTKTNWENFTNLQTNWENLVHRAMARINLWFYSGLQFLKRDEVYIGDPATSPQFWTKKQSQTWLQVRGLSFNSKLNAMEIKKLVTDYMSMPEVLLLLFEISVEENDIMNLVQLATDMFSLIMHDQVSDPYLKKLEWSIQVFLTRFDIVDSGVRNNSKEKPT